MPKRHFLRCCLAFAALAAAFPSFAADGNAVASTGNATAQAIDFDGDRYLHRWSKNGQNEFTPPGQEDLAAWRDMLTIMVRDDVRNAETLASLANNVLAGYQNSGQVIRTDSRPMSPQRPAEHLIVGALATRDLVEVVFNRLLLKNGTGIVLVYSHRAYGANAAQRIEDWLKSHGDATERALMDLESIPAPATLARLPQSE